MNLQLEKTGVDDYAVRLGKDFKNEFKQLIEKASDPLLGLLKNNLEINDLLSSKNYPKLDIEHLPPFCKRYLKWTSKSTHSADELLILAFLSTASACLRKSVQIRGPVNWAYPNIWAMFLGKSGSGKSTAVDIPLKMVHELDKPIFDQYQIDFDRYQEEVEEYEKAKKSKKKKQEGLVKKPQYPPCQVLSFPLISSLERLAEILSCDISYGLINTSEEMAAWLINLLKTENLKEFCTGCYNGKVPPNLVSYKTSRFLNMDEPILALCGPSTSEWIFNNLKHTDFQSGFLQRILFAINDTKKKKMARPIQLDSDERVYFKSKLEDLYQNGLKHMNDPKKFELEESAWQRFEELFESLEQRKRNIQDDVIISCLDRYWNDYLFKFALVLHVMQDDWRNKPTITTETLNQAALIIEYYEAVILHVLEDLQNKDAESMMKKIIDQLRKTKELNLKYDDLANQLQGYSRHKTTFNIGIHKLIETGIIEVKQKKNKSNNQVPTKEVFLLQSRA